MGALRDRMVADLKLAGYRETTREQYLQYARQYTRHFMRPPEEMGEEYSVGIHVRPTWVREE